MTKASADAIPGIPADYGYDADRVSALPSLLSDDLTPVVVPLQSVPIGRSEDSDRTDSSDNRLRTGCSAGEEIPKKKRRICRPRVKSQGRTGL